MPSEEKEEKNTDFLRRVTELTDDAADKFHRHFNKGILQKPEESLTTLVITLISKDERTTKFVCFAGAIRTLENFTKEFDDMTVCCKTMWMNNPSLKCDIEKEWKPKDQDPHSIAYRLIKISNDGEYVTQSIQQQASISLQQTQHVITVRCDIHKNDNKNIHLLHFTPEIIKG